MTESKVWLVQAESGSSSEDLIKWVVCAYESEDDAIKHRIRLSEAYTEFKLQWKSKYQGCVFPVKSDTLVKEMRDLIKSFTDQVDEQASLHFDLYIAMYGGMEFSIASTTLFKPILNAK